MLCQPEVLPTASILLQCRNCGAAIRPLEQRECDAEATLDAALALIAAGREIVLTHWQRQRVAEQLADNNRLSREEFAQLFPAMTDPTLIGNRLKLVFERVGVPPCTGCEDRAAWLNSANDLLRTIFGVI